MSKVLKQHIKFKKLRTNLNGERELLQQAATRAAKYHYLIEQCHGDRDGKPANRGGINRHRWLPLQIIPTAGHHGGCEG